MKISILGTGCPKCLKTEEVVRKVVSENKVAAEIEKIKEIEKIIEYGVMMTPAVAVDGRVVIAGKLPTEVEVKKVLGL